MYGGDVGLTPVDSHSEHMLKQAIQAAGKGRTCIAIAHRLASVQHADRIYVLDEGRAVEMGTHGELMGRGGVYAGMSEQQSLN